MKLVVDTHHLMLENAGTKRVTINLLAELKKAPEIEVIELQPGYSLKKGVGLASKLKGHFLRFFWVHIHLPFKCYTSKADFLLSPEFNTPMFCPCPRAVIAHDAHMRAQREYTSALWFYFYYIPFIESAIRKSDLVFTVSEFAKNQVVSLMKVKAEKVFVAYNGVDNLFLQERQVRSGALQNDIVAGKYILFVGTFEARKNIELLLEAFATFKKAYAEKTSDFKLAIVGQPAVGKYSDRSNQILSLIDGLKLEQEVVLCGFIHDDDLPDYYMSARFLVFPSTQEGFGLPIIEAFASGTPVISSNVCSMPEIAGDAALLFDPNNMTELADRIAALYFDIELHKRLIAKGKEQVKQFTWEKMATSILSTIHQYIMKS
jgi:glycosyltransferase involved in cell wall biosynthesis